MIVVDRRMNNRAPGKRSGQATGQRRIDGELALDFPGASRMTGWSIRSLRGKVARRLIPFHRHGGRIFFLRSELKKFLRDLPGCTAEEAVGNIKTRMGARQ